MSGSYFVVDKVVSHGLIDTRYLVRRPGDEPRYVFHEATGQRFEIGHNAFTTIMQARAAAKALLKTKIEAIERKRERLRSLLNQMELS